MRFKIFKADYHNLDHCPEFFIFIFLESVFIKAHRFMFTTEVENEKYVCYKKVTFSY